MTSALFIIYLVLEYLLRFELFKSQLVKYKENNKTVVCEGGIRFKNPSRRDPAPPHRTPVAPRPEPKPINIQEGLVCGLLSPQFF